MLNKQRRTHEFWHTLPHWLLFLGARPDQRVLYARCLLFTCQKTSHLFAQLMSLILSCELNLSSLEHAESRLSYAGVFGGVAMYTIHDIHFTVAGYVWLGVWYSFAVFEMVYVKKVVDTVEMTTWSRTYYQVRDIHDIHDMLIRLEFFPLHLQAFPEPIQKSDKDFAKSQAKKMHLKS